MTQHQPEDEVRAVYDQVADTYADRFTATEPESPVELAMVEHFVSRLPDGRRRVLDAGCGAGRLLPLLAGWGADAAGVDLAPGMVRRARQDHPEFPVAVASLTALPFADASFDGVMSWYSTVHLSEEALTTGIREMHRVLRPGGLLLVAFQVGRGARDVADGLRRLGHDVVLVRHHRSVEQVAGLLTAAGLEEEARLSRAPVGPEPDPQAVVIGRRTAGWAAGEQSRPDQS